MALTVLEFEFSNVMRNAAAQWRKPQRAQANKVDSPLVGLIDGFPARGLLPLPCVDES